MSSQLTFSNTPYSCLLSFPAYTNAKTYTISYTVGSNTVAKYTAQKRTQFTSCFISNLTPGSTYSFTVDCFGKTGTTVLHTYTGTTTLPALSTSNFSKAAFPETTPNIAALKAVGSVTPEKAVAQAFATGDVIRATTASNNAVVAALPVKATVVQVGASAAVKKNTNLYLPFDPSVATAQTVTLTLSNASSVPVTFNNTNNTVTIGGTTRSVGDRFLLDGQYVTVQTA